MIKAWKKWKSAREVLKEVGRINFDQCIEVVILRNQGWKFRQIGEKLGITKQRASIIFERFSSLKVKDLETLREMAENENVEMATKLMEGKL